MSISSSKALAAALFKDVRMLFAFAAILMAGGLPFVTSIGMAQRPAGRAIVFPASIQWNKQTGVTTYRLQIAADEKFQNVFADRRVMSNRYVVSDLAPGTYYWRVASADSQLGNFSRPVRLFVSGGMAFPVRLPTRGVGPRSLRP